ncbi:MAG: hypothetical protein JSS64_10785 [Bacteroidetes bacterium]|nr:hypothetical protein [Bacteroidota bacterium]
MIVLISLFFTTVNSLAQTMVFNFKAVYKYEPYYQRQTKDEIIFNDLTKSLFDDLNFVCYANDSFSFVQAVLNQKNPLSSNDKRIKGTFINESGNALVFNYQSNCIYESFENGSFECYRLEEIGFMKTKNRKLVSGYQCNEWVATNLKYKNIVVYTSNRLNQFVHPGIRIPQSLEGVVMLEVKDKGKYTLLSYDIIKTQLKINACKQQMKVLNFADRLIASKWKGIKK